MVMKLMSLRLKMYCTIHFIFGWKNINIFVNINVRSVCLIRDKVQLVKTILIIKRLSPFR